MLVLRVALMVVLYSFQSLFTRLYSLYYAGADKNRATPVFSVCYGGFIALISLAAGGFSFRPSGLTVLLAVLGAAMLLLYNRSMIEAGNRGSYSFLMMAGMFGGILVPLLTGILFLGERLSGLQIFAVLLMLGSMAVINARGVSFRGNSGSYYLWCALLFLANGLYGVILNLQARAMDGGERTEMLTILFAVSALAAAAPLLRQKNFSGFRMGGKAAVCLAVCCVSAAAAANLLLSILPQMPSGILYTVDNGGVLVLSILYSLLLFHERPRWEQAVGMAAAVVSICLINLG